MTGAVLSYDAVRCYGFIKTDDGEKAFVHRTEIVSAPHWLVEGERVEFDVQLTPKGLRAVGVTRLAPSAPVEGAG